MERHDTLLIACGSTESRKHLRSVLESRYNLLEATNMRQMILLLAQNLSCIASLVLDITNWSAIDQQIHSDAHAVELLKQVPVIIVSDKESYRDLTLYFRYGAADVIPLNYDPYAMLHRIETITELSVHRKHLETIVEEQTNHLRQFSDNMVDALSTVIEYRNLESGLHVKRIRNFTRILLEEVMGHLPEYDLTEAQVTMISSASALHDVGKIGIPDAILTKAGNLTPEEWEVMKTHSLLGCKMLDTLTTTVEREYLRYAYNICRYHHERWDGSGYPDGLKEDEIPICAHVVGLADCYDALTSKRVYKDACSHTQAMNMILGGECGAFSPRLLECFKNAEGRLAQLNEEYAEGRDPGDSIADMTLPASAYPTTSLLERTQAKYYCLVHYINAFLMEVQLDTGMYQVIYNPYPDLARIQGAKTLQELTDYIACQVVIPEERDRMYQVIWKEIPNFIQQDLRRQSFYFHYRPYGQNPGGPFEMTFLRIGSLNRRPSLAILCRKLEQPLGRTPQEEASADRITDVTYVCRNDSGFTLVRPGRDTVSLGGYTPQEVMDLFGGRLLDMAFPEDREQIRREFDRQLKSGSMVRTEYRFPCKDGSVGWVANKSRLVIGEDGQEYIHTFLHDITASKAATENLRQALARYQIILAQTENVLFDLDFHTGAIQFSDTWETIFGYKPSQSDFARQMAGETHVHPDDIALLLDRMKLVQAGSDYETVEIRIATDQGQYLWCRIRASALRDETKKLTNIVGVIININAEKQAQQALENKADRDGLTQLLNKEASRRKIERYLAQRHPAPQGALLLLDLDNFKDVNDTYGHLFGDALLTQISRILISLFHSQDILARIGGDEFLVLVRGVCDRHLLASQCRRLRDMLIHTFRNDALRLQLGCSIGIALCPEHSTNYVDLFTKADQALYHAKARGKNNYCFYSEAAAAQYTYSHRQVTPIDSNQELGLAKNDISYQVFRTLHQAADIPTAINQVLALMGTRANVSRVYIFEDSADGKYCTNTFEWCAQGIQPEISNLQQVSYETDIPGYRENFNEDGVFYCHDVRDLSPSAYAVVEPQGIQSMLHCAIRQKGIFRGYIGFDECSKKRLWTKEEIEVLTYSADILSMFLLQYREQERARIQAEELESILENTDQWIYIVDPQTHSLQFLNNRIRQDNPRACLGALCHQALFDKAAPCSGCPIAGLRNKSSNWAILEDPRSPIQILAEASRIKWEQQDSCMVTCRRLPT